MITIQREELEGVLEALESVTLNCEVFHHAKADQHKLAQECQPMQRYLQAISTLRARLAEQRPEPPLMVKTAPKRIWLNIFTDEEDLPFPDHEGITWSEDVVGDADVEYVRADLASSPPRPELSDEEILSCLIEASCLDKVLMTYDSGPYSITKPSRAAVKLARAIERKVRG